MSSEAMNRDRLLEVLRGHIGRANGVRGHDLAREIDGFFADARSQRSMRKLIEELRREGHHICGHPSAGYYLAANDEEITETCAFLESRAMSSLTQAAAMKRVSIPDLVGQLKLPT